MMTEEQIWQRKALERAEKINRRAKEYGNKKSLFNFTVRKRK